MNLLSRIFCVVCSLLLLHACVVIYPSGGTAAFKTVKTDTVEALELLLARFPLSPNTPIGNNSLHVTAINQKEKLIAEVTLDTISDIPETQNVQFRITIRDFDKTRRMSSTVLCPIRLFQDLKFEHSTGQYYRASSKSTDSIESCLLENTSIELDSSDIFLSVSGRLFSSRGSRVTFWGQSDVVPAKMLYGAIIWASNEMDYAHSIIDLCEDRVDEAKRRAQCTKGKPTLYLDYITRPLSEIFGHKIYEHFYLDCRVTNIICAKQ